jgi:uncharacterized protein YecA (UPF0149 family)
MKHEINTKNTGINITTSSCCIRSSCCSPDKQVIRTEAKVGRNDPCPCDSGKKFKKCCGNNIIY